MSMMGNRKAVIHHRLITLNNQVRSNSRMPRAKDFVAHTGDRTIIEGHGR